MAVNTNVTSGLIRGPGPNGEIIGGFDGQGVKTVKPLTFLGGTVLSFNATLGIGPLEESSLSLEIINDCKAPSYEPDPKGDYFKGPGNIGAPVFFDLGEATSFEQNRGAYEIKRDQQIALSGVPAHFKFGGILQSYTANQSSSGLTFSARVIDPRSLLSGVNIVIGNTLTGPIKHRNYYNVYAYYEEYVLRPSLRTPQPSGGYLLSESRGTDGPVKLLEGFIDQDENPAPDCSVFGAAHSNDQGMLYIKIREALEKMNLMVFSPNYAETHVPELLGRDLVCATFDENLRHGQNVFKVDISELPTPPEAPLYFRIAGPNITLLDFINTVCEQTGHIFHVELIESTNINELHTIKIRVANVKNLNNVDFKNEIVRYNGKATDLSYGKELSSENTRTLLIGEQKHQMYETSNIVPWFGEDKNGDPIIPKISGFTHGPPKISDPNEQISDCGWTIEIYLDEINYLARCPLYDYAEHEGDPRETQVINRKVEVTEYHIRLAASSFEAWKRFVFNPYNTEDFSRVIRRNFPDLTTQFLQEIYNNSKTLTQRAFQARDQLEAPPVSGTGTPPQHTDNAAGKSLSDQLMNFSGKMSDALRIRQEESIQAVYDYISNIARTYYGKKYLAVLAKELCVTNPEYVDLRYINPEGVEITDTVTIYNDPCASGTENTTVLQNKVWAPKLYSHTPTNDGAWIEKCGAVLGLGSQRGEHIYLDFFRSDDGRVMPMARFDSKVLSTLNSTEALIDDGTGFKPGVTGVSSVLNGLFESGTYRSGVILDAATLLFSSGICGDLDTREWSRDSFIKLQESGVCGPPTTGMDPLAAVDFPGTVWAKMTVGEKIYLGSGCLEYGYPERVVGTGIKYECCGKWQTDVPNAPCFWPGPLAPPENEDCYNYEWRDVTKQSCGVSLVPIEFDNGCYTKYCDDMNAMEAAAAEVERLLSEGFRARGLLSSDSNADAIDVDAISFDPYKQQILYKGSTLVSTSPRFCYLPRPTGIALIASALDFSQSNNMKVNATAFIPTAVAIPVKSNIETYGPWKTNNFETSSGGVEVVHDQDFCPWNFESVAAMNTFAMDFLHDKAFNRSELETGSVTIPYFPEKPLGFIQNGPNLTNINVSMGSNGVNTTYSYRTYTPKFGGLKALEKKSLKDNLALVHQVRKLTREKQRKIDIINRRTSNAGTGIQSALNPSLTSTGTLQRVIVGETYPFSVFCVPTSGDQDGPLESGWTVVGTGDRTVVGTDTLQKSVLELRYDYRKKAFMSWDGLLSPVANTRPSGSGGFVHDLPIYGKYAQSSGQAENQSQSIYSSPNPPIRVSGENLDEDVYNLRIDQEYLNPLQNHFSSGNHPHHWGRGAGHNIDIVGRGSEMPESGVIMNFYGQKQWDNRYSDEYRFLGLRGPLVLHQWGYDTQGKPIPNAIDDEKLIRESGIFRTVKPSGDSGVYPYVTGSGLSDYFMRDWLQKPSSWPVAPIDLRFDRKRGVWVSPPDYKMVVVEADEVIDPYSSGDGFLINERGDRVYNEKIYDKEGKLIKATTDTKAAKITIEDRIGRAINPKEKSYAYFDSFTSTYLLMGGGNSIKIGKFCNQWPSLSNVKDPKNAVKEVVLYSPVACSGEPCPWNLQPQMAKVNGVDVPVTVQAINLFSNVGAHEYQTKWCAIVQNGTSYYLLAAEC